MNDTNEEPLMLGNATDVLSLLDFLYQVGGIKTVKKWVTTSLCPSRKIMYEDRITEGETEIRTIADRSLWVVNPEGEITQKVLLTPLTKEEYGESEFFAHWIRPKLGFALRLRVKTKNN